MNSAVSCIENAYYLNLGHHGIEHKDTIRYYEQLERYRHQKLFYQEDTERNDYKEDFKNRKIVQGNIRVFTGKGENFSFKVPYTNLSEPYLMSLYKDNKFEGNDNEKDKFSSSLFMTNLYLDKNDLFRYLKIPDKYRENYLLYTDENMNIILETIIVDNNYNHFVVDPKLNAIVFSSSTPKNQRD